MTRTSVAYGVNLMPPIWDGRAPVAGPPLLARRRRLMDRMTQAGMDHVMLGDHVMFQGGLGNDGLIDAASAISANDRLDIYLSVFLLVLRHPVLVARQVLTVDQLGPGRLTLGVGIGGDDRSEVAACGVDPKTRGRRMDEALALFRRLLTGESVTFTGEFFTLAGARLEPVPGQVIPVVVGGRSDAALRRAGRFGDGWLGIWTSVGRCREAMVAVEEHGREAGRPDVAWQHGMTFWCGFGRDRSQARDHVAPIMEGFYRVPFDKFGKYIPHGSPAAVAEHIAPYVAAGCRTVNFIPFADSDEAAIDAAAEVVQILNRSS